MELNCQKVRKGLSKSCVQKTYKPWNEQDKAFVAANYRSMTPKAIALALGRTESSIKNQAHKAGVASPRWSEEDLNFMRKNAAKMTIRQFAAHFNKSMSCISSVAHIRKISLFKAGDDFFSTKHSDEDVLLIRQLAESGLSYSEIGKKFEISAPFAHQLANSRLTAQDGLVRRLLSR
ncbi:MULTISPECIES: hypothetical protein [Enterobacter cloacae complex]|uniref:hypothetical protein n=1 Tax=Enterobacter cloacae complex TaxID=354276 RepID=UPI00065046E4|nr:MULTISPECIES: hypothetical protein [Enterobacter cloacae complex]KLW25403.1 hypothetical protein SK49_02459 [Enterobacter sp. BWH63]MDE7561471.1 hypothetical protein [Enterobacter hormaechei]PTX84790.1 hypothetical protein C1N97_13625 [Enterobacter hormaechei]